MPNWPEKRQILGTGVPRLDGAPKVSGAAKYSFDRNLPGMLHAKILRSPHAHAKIAELDLAPAEAMPGVKAVHPIKAAGAVLRYGGDEIAAVAAETEEQARDAARAIRVKYEVLAPVTNEADGLKKPGEPKTDEAGDLAAELGKSDAVIEGRYGAAVIGHVCLESHGLVAHWRAADDLLVYASTQAVHATANALRNHFKAVQGLKVTCETPFMGGGFGSKFGPDVQGIACAELALKAKRPVKLMLERDEEHWAGGSRPSAYAEVKAGASKDGTLRAIDATTWGTGGHSGSADFPFPYIYAPVARKRSHRNVAVNAGDRRALRAPGHPQGCLVMEQVMDDLADKLGIDPLEFRLKNIPEAGNFKILKPIYEKEMRLGAERIGWKNRHKRGEAGPGPVKRGLGMACGTWGGAAGQAQATCTIHPSGEVEVVCGTQDLGTGTATLVPMVAAEILGLQVSDVQGRIGTSAFPQAGGSGGSTSCGGVSLAVALASMAALKQVSDLAAAKLGVAPEAVEAEGGRIYVKAEPAKGLGWKQACALLGAQPAVGNGDRKNGDGMSSSGVGGVQFADVSVDVETGEVRMNKLVAIADCGMVMNRLLCESQVIGGVVGGINSALFEERRLDPLSGLMLNPDMEHYKLAAHSDLGEIDVVLLDYPERGVIGIGEPPYVPTAAAIANAVCNAIGARPAQIPFTPRRILDALA